MGRFSFGLLDVSFRLEATHYATGLAVFKTEEPTMKRLALAVAFAGIVFTLNGCAVYVSPYDHIGFSYGYAPYSGYSYGYAPYSRYSYGYPRFRRHSYDWGGRGYGWRGRGWH